jgi:hypothetical protein
MPRCLPLDRSRVHLVSLTCMLAMAGAACNDSSPAGEPEDIASVAEQTISTALLQSRCNTIKSVHASHATIHNPLLFAGIAYTETQLAHCYLEYYNQVSTYVCAGPSSSDCGGAVTAGYWDAPTCSQQAGGLSMWQFDEGNYTQTLNKWSSTGYWQGKPHNILSVTDSTSAAIDFILFKAWYSSYTPYFSSDQAMYNWINGIRPVNGNSDYETWLGFIANSYNGQVWGSSGWSATKEKYRTSTSYLYSAMGGNSYWYSTSLPACGAGLYCSVGSVSGASQCMSGTQPLYCCPSGQTIVNGVCTSSTPPPCGSGLYCSGSSIPGSSQCMSGSQLVYCCAAGHVIVNGACSP